METFLNELRARTVTSTPLAGLENAHLKWREIGANLGAISILANEGQSREANALLQQTVSALPPTIRNAFAAPPP